MAFSDRISSLGSFNDNKDTVTLFIFCMQYLYNGTNSPPKFVQPLPRRSKQDALKLVDLRCPTKSIVVGSSNINTRRYRPKILAILAATQRRLSPKMETDFK